MKEVQPIENKIYKKDEIIRLKSKGYGVRINDSLFWNEEHLLKEYEFIYLDSVCSVYHFRTSVQPIEDKLSREQIKEPETDIDKGWIIVDEKEFCKIVTAIQGEEVDNIKQIVKMNFTGEELLEFCNDFLSVHYSNKFLKKEEGEYREEA